MFSIYLGAQLKILYNIRLSCDDLFTPCKIKGYSSWIIAARGIYSDSLTAILLPIPTTLQYANKRSSELVRLCSSSVELHFDEFMIQKEDTTKKFIQFQIGDFFLTRHSNLGNAHLIFHMGSDKIVTVNDNMLTPKSPILLGFKNVLTLASQYDISVLYIPLPIVAADVPEATLGDPVCLKRTEQIIKQLKTFLTTTPSSLRLIHLILPTSSEQIYNKYKNLLKTLL